MRNGKANNLWVDLHCTKKHLFQDFRLLASDTSWKITQVKLSGSLMSPSLPIVHFGSTDSFTQWSHAFVSAAKAIGFTWLETPRMSELVLETTSQIWFSQIGNSSPPARAKPPWRAAATPPASTEAKSKNWVAQNRRKCHVLLIQKYDGKVKPNKALAKRNMESFLSGWVLVCPWKQLYMQKLPNLWRGFKSTTSGRWSVVLQKNASYIVLARVLIV